MNAKIVECLTVKIVKINLKKYKKTKDWTKNQMAIRKVKQIWKKKKITKSLSKAFRLNSCCRMSYKRGSNAGRNRLGTVKASTHLIG